MRCIVCDANSNGLSLFRPDQRFHSTKFHTTPNGDTYCSECYESGEEVWDDYNYEDTEEEDE